MRRSAFIASMALVVSGLVVTPAVGADTYDEQFTVEYPTDPNPAFVPSYGMFAAAIPQGKITPALLAFEADGTKRNQSLITAVGLCDSMDNAHCKDAEYIQYDAMIPYCSAAVLVDCIAGLSASDATGKPLTVTIVDRFKVPGYDYTGDPTLQLPVGREGVLFKVDGVTHPGGDLFLAYADIAGDKVAGEAKFNVSFFRARIAAVRLESQPGQPPMAETQMSGYEQAAIGRRSASGGSDNCVLRTVQVCATAYPLPLEVSFGMTLKLATALNGWLHGRFSEPTAAVSMTGAVQQVKIQAKPVKVPSAVGWMTKAAMPKDLADFYSSLNFVGGLGIGCSSPDLICTGPLTWVSVLRSVQQQDEQSMREFTMWLKYIGDKAVSVPTAWLVQTTSGGSGRAACFEATDKLSGIVMTNATSYISGPPSFNEQTQSLDYKVAAPHFMPDGKTLFQGTYDLLIRSDVARCIYGFSNAPVSAKVSVLSDAGEMEVATTVVNEKDGWLSMHAAGFTFSSPTVRVKLTQAAPAAPKPVMKMTAITCVKGKVSKKVAAAKCPAGYRKK